MKDKIILDQHGNTIVNVSEKITLKKKDKNKEIVTQTIYLRKDQVKMNEKLAKKLGMKKNEFMRLVFDTFYNVIEIED